MSDLRASVIIDLAGNLDRRAQRYGQSLRRFSERGSRDLGRLARASAAVGRGLDRLTGRYTQMIGGAAAAYAGTRAIIESGKLDKQLTQIRQTAGATVQMAALLREELHTMAEQTGQSMDSLLGGFNNLVQAGLEWDQALLTIKAINPAMAVTGAQAEVLSSALTVAGEAFKFNLAQPKLAAELLDQMTVAGRLGNAELEDLSGIFARVGINAKAANLSFSETLGFIEQLSLIERNPERLSTLADSTLRLFTNQKYLESAAKATGVSFYDAKGQRRAAFDVLDEIAAKYKQLSSDIDRDQALSAAFGNVDLDTLKGLRALLSGDAIGKARAMSREIAGSTGAIGKNLEDALGNSVDQVARLKRALGSAADEFAQPVNDAIERAIRYLMDEKKLGGKELLLGGAGAALAGFGLLKGGGKLLQRLGSTASGVAAGKALEEVAGVQPVYVVNMPGGLGGMPGLGGKGLPGFNPKRFGGWRAGAAMLGGTPLSRLSMMGAGAVGTAGLAVAGAGAAGYGVGTVVNENFIAGTKASDSIGRGMAKFLAFFGNDEAQAALASERRYRDSMRGELHIKIDQEGRARVKQMRGENFEMSVDTGLVMGP